MGTKRRRRGISRRGRREIRERREAEQRGRSVRRAREAERTEKHERDLAGRLAESRAVTGKELLDRSVNFWQYRDRRSSRARRLVEIVLERRPKLADQQTVRLLWALSEVNWVQAAESWRPAGRGAWRGLRSLIDHLLVRYPVPPFLYGALIEDATQARSNGRVVRFFQAAGAGLSFHRKAREIFGVPLTKRMTALIAGTPKGYAMYPAIRRAQLLAFGGDEAMEEWHRELARLERLHGHIFTPSGFAGGIWEGRPSGPNKNPPLWTMEEILNSKDLAREGRIMHHCVASYGWLIERGSCSIWSLRREEARRVTVEVENRTRRIVQARGRWNAPPKRSDLNYLFRWARENGLALPGCR